uniref:ubiquitinyl hydrolase 1 n=1 Tax=Phallusia mammillata TaxID=59560 RepID=A0A6F9DMC6_9ASCI|nr:OTU domain-containing protein 5 [Phallusia mammillata]
MTILPKKKVPKEKTTTEGTSHEHHTTPHHAIGESHSSRSRLNTSSLRTAPHVVAPPEERHRVGRGSLTAVNIPQSVDLPVQSDSHCSEFVPSVINQASNLDEPQLVHAIALQTNQELSDPSGTSVACDLATASERTGASKRRHGRISPHAQPYSRGKPSRGASVSGASSSSSTMSSHVHASRQHYVDDRRPISPSGVVRGARRRQRSRPEPKEERSTSGQNSDDEHDVARLRQLNKDVDFEELERTFAETLKNVRGFYVKEMVEDGACLFRAVADQVYGDQTMHDEVRTNCMDYMMKNADFFSPYVTEDFRTYITRKKLPHTYGNHLEMQAMAELYNRLFEVYQYSTEPINIFHSSNKSENDPIRVSYHRNSHYNSVINPYKASIGVGLGLPSFTPGLADQMLLETAQRSSEQELLEQQMLEDKLRAADWENTEDELVREVAHESFVDYLRHQEELARQKKQLDDTDQAGCASKEPSCSQTSLTSEQETLQQAAPHHSKVEEQSCSYRESQPSTSASNHFLGNPGMGDWVDETDENAVLAQVLAQSQREYYESLTHHESATSSSAASCSKYPTDK